MTVSTDYVFDGTEDRRVHRRTTSRGPLNRYGESKLEGERQALAAVTRTPS